VKPYQNTLKTINAWKNNVVQHNKTTHYCYWNESINFLFVQCLLNHFMLDEKCFHFEAPWNSVGWHSVGDFYDIRSADTMPFFSDFVSAEIISVIFWHNICRRYVIFSDLKSVLKKWIYVGRGSVIFFLT
jgi:hypothetical protein